MLVFATSDKGGTGRTVTASNIAYQLSLQGKRVCYVDFDFGSPTAGAVFGLSATPRGTRTGRGTHNYLRALNEDVEFCDVWAGTDRMSLRQRPPGSGRLVLVPGDYGGGEFASSDEIVDRCAGLLLRLQEEFEITLVDLSAGRSYATDIVLAALRDPALREVTARWLVFHRWTRQHIVAASGLVNGPRSLMEIGQELGHDPARLRRSIRFIRTAVIDPRSPDQAGLRPAQLSWLAECDRELRTLAAGAGLGSEYVLGRVPLDPILQWREQLITESDVWSRHVANEVTLESFQKLAKVLDDPDRWNEL